MRNHYEKVRKECKIKVLKGGTSIKNDLFNKVDSIQEYNPSYIQIESRKVWGGEQKTYKIKLPDGRKVVINYPSIEHPGIDKFAQHIIRFTSTINYIQNNPGSVILIDSPGHSYRHQSINERVDYYTKKYTKDINDFLETIDNDMDSKEAQIIQPD
jgi:hypothetical protein